MTRRGKGGEWEDILFYFFDVNFPEEVSPVFRNRCKKKCLIKKRERERHRRGRGVWHTIAHEKCTVYVPYIQ